LKNYYKYGNSYNAVLTLVATIGFLGYFPFAPGTIGTLFALVLFLLTDVPLYAHFLIIIIGALLGIHASTVAEKTLKEKDSKKIIIDEFIGFYISVLYLPKTLLLTIAAFLLFRFFDILKPFPIKKIESLLGGGIGIVADDIMAALYTNLILQIWKLIYYNP